MRSISNLFDNNDILSDTFQENHICSASESAENFGTSSLNSLNFKLSTFEQLAALHPAEREEYLRKMALPKSRQNPVIMKLETSQFKSILSDELTALVALFKEYGHEIRVAGGAVRYGLLLGCSNIYNKMR